MVCPPVSDAHGVCGGCAGGSSTASSPRSLMPLVVTHTASWYVPGATVIVAPGEAASTAAWIEPPGPTTTAAEAAGAATTTAAAAIMPAAANRNVVFHWLIAVLS